MNEIIFQPQLLASVVNRKVVEACSNADMRLDVGLNENAVYKPV